MAQFARGPSRRPTGPVANEPHAALLIDFDNVTMGIRSDLTKELKNLLNSDIIKGKVAVQRAYADWRRYPQYIVPLAESSVDLIFAPAYGSAKKNATDIRLAIDAIELVFTRPEIGTIILLSGDSDFSSLVLKLKEYGKYVIGVGIRESASDLLVQNCDEYYSYSALTGLTRAGEEAPIVSEDPWELTEMALRQMIEKGDVMRSDRLKQVLLEMDPSFDEKALGFQKFNKFLQEAASRGLLSLRKQENGQFEVGPPSAESQAAAETQQEGREPRRGGRGRRGRRREEGRREVIPPPAEEAEIHAEVEAAETEARAEPVVPEAPEPVAPAAPVAAPAPVVAAPAEAKPAVAPAAAAASTSVEASYDLLRRAATDLVRRNGPVLRDSDVKRRMLELEPGWDESTIGFSKFSRFLRQAHDAKVISVRKLENGNFDVLLGEGDIAPPAEERAPRGRREERGGRDRGRGRGRDRERGPREGSDVGMAASEAPRATQATPAAEQTPAQAREAEQPAVAQQTAPAAQQRAAAEARKPEPPVTPPAEPPRPREAAISTEQRAPAAPPAPVGFRRGSRGRAPAGGPPPLLEGQTAFFPSAVTAAPPPSAPAAAAAPAAPPAMSQDAPSPGGVTAEPPPAKAARKVAAKKAEAARFDPSALGLPRGAGEIAAYLSAYKGVGPKSIQTLIESFGPSKVYDALQNRPEKVREALGSARGERLLEAWNADIAQRRAGGNGAPDAQLDLTAEAAEKPAKKATRRGGRRGGRKQPARK
jgi:uncharacterized protein (TIGR00288 family)